MLNSFNALFISDPDSANKDATAISRINNMINNWKLIDGYFRMKISIADTMTKVFPTHPSMAKCLRILQRIEREYY